MRNALRNISWPIALLLAATLGLAPFFPEPHIWEKLKMLMAGELRATVDVFDMLMHGLPWLLVFAKLAETATSRTN